MASSRGCTLISTMMSSLLVPARFVVLAIERDGYLQRVQSGMYSLLRMRQLGLATKVLEAGSGEGGTWFWWEFWLTTEINRQLTLTGTATLGRVLIPSHTPIFSHSTSRCSMSGTGVNISLVKKRLCVTVSFLQKSTTSTKTCNSTLGYRLHGGARTRGRGFSQITRARHTLQDMSSVVWVSSTSQLCPLFQA